MIVLKHESTFQQKKDRKRRDKIVALSVDTLGQSPWNSAPRVIRDYQPPIHEMPASLLTRINRALLRHSEASQHKDL